MSKTPPEGGVLKLSDFIQKIKRKKYR